MVSKTVFALGINSKVGPMCWPMPGQPEKPANSDAKGDPPPKDTVPSVPLPSERERSESVRRFKDLTLRLNRPETINTRSFVTA